MPEEIGQPGNEEDLNKEVALEESLESELTEQDKTELDNILADLKNFDFEKLDGIKPKFHEKIALRLIEGGRGHYIPYYLNRFKGLDHRRIALKLVESGDVDDLAFYLRNFKGLDHREIALKILERGKANVNSFLRSLKNFQNIDFNEIALKLIEEGKVEAVAEHLNEFHNLSNEVALKLIEKGEGNKVGVYIDRFQGLNYQEIALALIAARKSIILADTIEKFHGLDRKEIALRIIQSGYGQYVIIERNIEKFHELDQEVALKLIEAGEGGKVVGCIEKFKDINYSEIALKLIERGCQQQLMNRSCWAKFKHLDRRVALSLMEHEGDSFVSFHLDDFHNLDQEIAIKLIEAGKNKGDGYNHVETVVRSLNKFEAIDFNEIALKLIDVGASKTVVENIDKFSGLGQEVALKLIEGGLGEWVIKNTDKFQGIVYQSVVIKLIESGQSNLIFQYEDKFKELYPEFVVLKEFQEAVKKRVIDVLIKSVKVDDAIVLAKRYSLPTEEIASVEIQQVASSKLGEMLRRGDIYFTKVLNEFFNLPPDIIKGIIENLPASQGYMACLLFDVDSGLKVKIWQELIQELEKDAFIAGKFQLANSLWGHKEWESIIKENLVFWQNPHDNLLFLEKIELLKEVRKDLFNPVLPPDFKLKDSEGSFFVAEEQRELFKLALQPIILWGYNEF